jgi:hypothetical protein
MLAFPKEKCCLSLYLIEKNRKTAVEKYSHVIKTVEKPPVNRG